MGVNKNKIGFIGAGQMGQHMVGNLLKSGFAVIVADRNPCAIEACVKNGASGAESIKQLVSDCDYIIVAVVDDTQVHSVMTGEGGVLEHATVTKVVMIASSVAPKTVQEIAEVAKKQGVVVADTPMSGAETGAKDASMTFMVGCDALEVFEEIKPILSAMGKSVFHLGPVGSGEAAKLANNTMGICNNLIALEAVKLAGLYGIAEDRFMEVVRVSSGNSFVAQNWPMVDAVLAQHSLAGSEEVHDQGC